MTPAPEREERGAGLSPVLRVGRVALVTVAVIMLLGVAIDRISASAAFCNACHEMQPAVTAWRSSSHTQVGCPACHESPRPWYQLPARLWDRGAYLTRDVAAHFSASGDGTASADAARAISDATCAECHEPDRTVTMRYGTLIDHKEHAARNKSCVSCHLWTGHPDPNADRPLLLMSQCFACHGRSLQAKAPGTCNTCHPPSFDERPASHAPSSWKTGHGKSAKADQPQCLMCHEKASCTDCHGVEMPHPPTWANGATGHGVAAARDRRVCMRCHEGGLQFCTMCHHEGYDARQGSWVDQHPASVETQGASACIECHGPVFCVKCHTATAD